MQSFIPLILIAGVMYVALILPQQRRNKEQRSLLASLMIGDEVVLNSGIHGFISDIDEQILWLEVAEKVELKVSRSAVAGKVQVETADTADSEDE